jgi:hypothetical protein
MGQHRLAVTAWEAEAARRREVVKADFADSARARRARMGIHAGSTGIIDRLAGLFATAARGFTDRVTDEVRDSDPCGPPVGALKPGC